MTSIPARCPIAAEYLFLQHDIATQQLLVMISRKSPIPPLLAVVFCLALAGCTTLQQRWQARQALRTADRLDAQRQPLAPDTLLDAAIAHYEQRRIIPYAKLARAYYYRGRMHRAARRYPQAMHDFAQARRHFTRRTPPALQGRTATNIAYLCASQGNDSLARVYYTEALDWFGQARDTSRMAYTLLDLGGVELRSDHPDRSLHYCRQVLPLAQDSMLHGYVLQDMGQAYYKLGQLDSSLHYMAQALHYPYETNNMGIRYLYMAYCYYDWQMLDSAAVYAQKAIDSTTDSNVHYSAYYMLIDWAHATDPSRVKLYSHKRADAGRLLKDRYGALTTAVSIIPLELAERENIHLKKWQGVWVLALLLCAGGACYLLARMKHRERRTRMTHEQETARLQQAHEHRLQEERHLQEQRRQQEKEQERQGRLERFVQTVNLRDPYLWKDWARLRRETDLCLNGFFMQLEKAYPQLSEQEMRLCLLTLLDYPYDDIANLINKSPESIGKMKQRLATKIGTSPKEMKWYLLHLVG